jgi:hypothetical protein
MSTELNRLGPALSDALDAFRAAASLAGRVQIVAHMTEKQHLMLKMKTVSAMAKEFELRELLRGLEDC